MKTAVDGDRLVVHLMPVRAWVILSFTRGAQLKKKFELLGS